MKKTLLTSGLAAFAALDILAAVPQIADDVTISWDADRRAVAVSFKLLDAPAIVTMAVETNAAEGVWTPVAERRVTRLAGPLNRLIEPADEVRTAWWMPMSDWPEAAVAAGTLRVRLSAWKKDAPPPYLVADLRSPNGLRYYASADAVPGGVQDRRYKTELLMMRKIEARNVVYRMGVPAGQPEDGGGWTSWTLNTPHMVTLTNDYYMSVFEFTRGQCKTLRGIEPANGATRKDADAELHPVDQIHPDWLRPSVDGRIVTKLRERTGLAAIGLPSGAEWEYACRAGCGTGIYTGKECDSEEACSEVAWWSGNSGGGIHAVGQKLPNAWGLYDMLGNVSEMVRDYFKQDLGSDPVVAPEFPTPVAGEGYGTCTTSFGGMYGRDKTRIRASSRNAVSDASSGYGFRFACPIVHEEEIEQGEE